MIREHASGISARRCGPEDRYTVPRGAILSFAG